MGERASLHHFTLFVVQSPWKISKMWITMSSRSQPKMGSLRYSIVYDYLIIRFAYVVVGVIKPSQLSWDAFELMLHNTDLGNRWKPLRRSQNMLSEYSGQITCVTNLQLGSMAIVHSQGSSFTRPTTLVFEMDLMLEQHTVKHKQEDERRIISADHWDLLRDSNWCAFGYNGTVLHYHRRANRYGIVVLGGWQPSLFVLMVLILVQYYQILLLVWNHPEYLCRMACLCGLELEDLKGLI
ncbi:unnamed protein product [Camellia sinensis]